MNGSSSELLSSRILLIFFVFYLENVGTFFVSSSCSSLSWSNIDAIFIFAFPSVSGYCGGGFPLAELLALSPARLSVPVPALLIT